ncbi:glucose-6-phosphate isomerase [Elongatibacter sediminis]|uniref:Glucose-6-phosphate isomerase n=1 Tax=Elongatibacter sediminis TaxID=3119006 RepID=A0AAW9RGA4_9GAMM
MNESRNIAEKLLLLRKSNSFPVDPGRLLRSDPDRFQRFSARLPGMLMDYSRNAVDDAGLGVLHELSAASIAQARQRMFEGRRINTTEDRAVLHHVWRSRDFDALLTPDEARNCRDGIQRMRSISSSLHAGHLPGLPDEPVRDVVHIGIGGSLLGPKLLCEAFPPAGPTPRVHFLSSVDALEREQLLPRLEARTTVVVVVSKSFSTSEVLAHGERLREWQTASLDDSAAERRRFAVTANPARAESFGVPRSGILPMGEWTGGRFSVWSPVGLTAAIAMGPDAFDRLCEGGASMDRHFLNENHRSNLPVLHGLLACWNRNVGGLAGHVLAPYDSRLAGLPAWLQQVSMESNGKSVTHAGRTVNYGTSPLVFGACGTDAQHALFQAFHQGTEVVPVDFIGVVRPDHPDGDAHTLLLSHLLAQATALALGRDAEEVRAAMADGDAGSAQAGALVPHRVMPGGRPSTVLLLDRLVPETLGMLLVLYEHSVFVQSVIWDINAFDQWGVELGKELCDRIVPALSGETAPANDLASLAGLVEEIRDRSR